MKTDLDHIKQTYSIALNKKKKKEEDKQRRLKRKRALAEKTQNHKKDFIRNLEMFDTGINFYAFEETDKKLIRDITLITGYEIIKPDRDYFEFVYDNYDLLVCYYSLRQKILSKAHFSYDEELFYLTESDTYLDFQGSERVATYFYNVMEAYQDKSHLMENYLFFRSSIQADLVIFTKKVRRSSDFYSLAQVGKEILNLKNFPKYYIKMNANNFSLFLKSFSHNIDSIYRYVTISKTPKEIVFLEDVYDKSWGDKWWLYAGNVDVAYHWLNFVFLLLEESARNLRNYIELEISEPGKNNISYIQNYYPSQLENVDELPCPPFSILNEIANAYGICAELNSSTEKNSVKVYWDQPSL